MQLIFLIGFVLISLAAGHYLYRAYCEYREKKEVERTLNPPEAKIPRILGDARRALPPLEYEGFEKGFYEIINKSSGQPAERVLAQVTTYAANHYSNRTDSTQ